MMTNRKWIKSMALIDFLTIFNKNNAECVLSLLGIKSLAARCDKYNDEEKDIDDCCYNCVCGWLNEQHKNFS